jgi:FKBP-type peptidyl-prolyl cis-trans isomerase
MNNPRPFLVGVLVVGGAVGAFAQDIKVNLPGSTPAPAAAPAPAFTNAQLVEEFGWFMGKRVGLADLGFTPAEVDALIKGVATAAGGRESPYDLQKIGPAMDDFMQKKQAVYLGKLKQQSISEAAAFFTKLKDNKNIVELKDGLRYEIIRPGTGAYPVATDRVKVNYTGTLINGSVFDSSVQRGQPAEFGLGEVIPGWTEGLQKISKGGKIKLYVPPDLAYGDEGRSGIPPGSALVFDIELIDILPPAPPAPAPAAAMPAPPAGK